MAYDEENPLGTPIGCPTLVAIILALVCLGIIGAVALRVIV